MTPAFIVWAVAAALYFGLLFAGVAAKKRRVGLWTAAAGAALLASLSCIPDGKWASVAAWMFIAVMAALSVRAEQSRRANQRRA